MVNSPWQVQAPRNEGLGAVEYPNSALVREPIVTHSYQAIDADGHILEPLDLWDKYIDPAFHDRRPRFVIDENGKERLGVEGKLLGNPPGIGSLGSVPVPHAPPHLAHP